MPASSYSAGRSGRYEFKVNFKRRTTSRFVCCYWS
jgi:hypothetical protein